MIVYDLGEKMVSTSPHAVKLRNLGVVIASFDDYRGTTFLFSVSDPGQALTLIHGLKVILCGRSWMLESVLSCLWTFPAILFRVPSV